MSEHRASIAWKRSGPDFIKGQYSREHTWTFDGGFEVPASPAPVNVPAPWSKAANVDPEEAFVASISSCHMLVFLWLASRAGFQADSYDDPAIGVMTKNERGALWVSKVTLRPTITWSGAKLPTAIEVEQLHHSAHEQCFIANSVKTEIIVEAAGSGTAVSITALDSGTSDRARASDGSHTPQFRAAILAAVPERRSREL